MFKFIFFVTLLLIVTYAVAENIKLKYRKKVMEEKAVVFYQGKVVMIDLNFQRSVYKK